MSFHFKALIVVIVLATLVFLIAKPVFVRFMTLEDFQRRRNTWLGLTVAAFVIPSFWAYMLVAAVVIYGVGRKDSNPAALYLFLLLLVPPIDEAIPGFGIVNQVFPLNHFRLLSLVVLLPAAVRLAKEMPHAQRKWSAADMVVVAYLVYQLLLMMPYVSMTGSVRRAFLLLVDVFLPYFVISRACSTRQKIVEAMAALVLGAAVLAPIGVLETVKGWLMYAGMGDHWNVSSSMGYLRRGEILRAQATSGQSIIFGTFFVVALGLWLPMRAAAGRGWWMLGLLAIGAGLAATLSRGPWVGGLVTILVFLAVGPHAVSRTFKGVAVLSVLSAIAIFSPWGDKIIDHLPFVGTVDTGNIEYRQVLLETSWRIIQMNPMFGSPYFLNYMEELRTGQGIIDLLNAYAAIAMSYGIVGLLFFVAIYAIALVQCFSAARRFAHSDPELSMIGASLFASIAGVSVIIYTVSYYLSIPYLHLSLAALALAYGRLAPDRALTPSQPVGSPLRPRPRRQAAT